VIDAEVVEEEGKIMLHSTCHEHGNFNNLYWSDPALYHRFERFEEVGTGVENPQNIAPPESCPSPVDYATITIHRPCWPILISQTAAILTAISVLQMPCLRIYL